MELAFEEHRQVSQVADAGAAVADFHRRDRVMAGADAIQEIPHVIGDVARVAEALHGLTAARVAHRRR